MHVVNFHISVFFISFIFGVSELYYCYCVSEHYNWALSIPGKLFYKVMYTQQP